MKDRAAARARGVGEEVAVDRDNGAARRRLEVSGEVYSEPEAVGVDDGEITVEDCPVASEHRGRPERLGADSDWAVSPSSVGGGEDSDMVVKLSAVFEGFFF